MDLDQWENLPRERCLSCAAPPPAPWPHWAWSRPGRPRSSPGSSRASHTLHSPLALSNGFSQSVRGARYIFPRHFFPGSWNLRGKTKKRKRQNFLKFSLEITKFSKYHPKRCKKGEQNKDKILIQIEMEFYPKLYKIISSIQVAI